MPRTARIKSADYPYHIMSRSISEVDLFRNDEDKDHYLKLLGRYKSRYRCRIYAYCLMNNHVHLFLDPQGFDVSRFMLSLNTAYVSYFNKKYERHGHLFQGRFASTVVSSSAYGMRLSAYINNNPKDISGYDGREEAYPYSSYGVYTGIRRNEGNILDTSYILGYFGGETEAGRERYKRYVRSMKGTRADEETEDEICRIAVRNEYHSGRQTVMRYETAEEIAGLIEKKQDKLLRIRVRAKHIRESSGIRSFFAYVLRVLCNYTYSQICGYIGNMTVSGVTRLVNAGYELICRSRRYQALFDSLITT